MENRYPLFAGGRILKKEALWDLRDYVYGGWQLQYMDYTDGVIKGCRIHVEDSTLIIGKGILKIKNFIFLQQEEIRIPFIAENRLLILKATCEIKTKNADALIYQIKYFLDADCQLQEDQIELCRFHLREGSTLRDTYENLRDMRTEYDTVNLINATIAGSSWTGIHPKIISRFLEQLPEKKEAADYGFSYLAMQNDGWISRKTLALYLADKTPNVTWQEVCMWDNSRIVDRLEALLSSKYDNGRGNTHKNIIYVE